MWRVVLATWFPALLCWQSLQLFQSFARDHGNAGLLGRAALLSTLNVSSLLLTTVLGSRAWDVQGDDDAEWLSTLPASVWALRAAKLAEAAFFNPFAWLMLWPFFTGLGLVSGLGLLAPVLAVAITLPLSVCYALLGGIFEATQLALSPSPILRWLRFVAPALAVLAFVGWLLAVGLSRLKIDALGHWFSFSDHIGWLPFSEPARALLALRVAPARGLAWLVLFALEMGVVIGVGTFTLSKLYRSDFGARPQLRRGPARRLTPPSPRRAFGGSFGAVASKDWLWLRRNPARVVGVGLQLVIFNALAILAARLAPGIHSAQLPGVALLAVGGLLTVSLLEVLLEAERPALWHWASLPRSITWLLSRKALLAATVGVIGALPTSSYIANSVAGVQASAPALCYGAACVCLLAFFHVAFWVRGVNPNAPASVQQGVLRLAQTVFIAAILHAGFASLTTPATIAPSLTLAVAFACTFWQALPERLALSLDPSASRAPALTATYALGTVLILQFVRGFVLAVATRTNSSPAHATAIAVLIGGSGVLSVSLVWLWLRGVPTLREQLGLGQGKGPRVILREALLWSVPAVLFNQAYWALSGWRAAGSIQPAPEPPATMTVLAGSPLALVGAGVIGAPILEELLFRGMLFRSLRKSWALAPSLLLSTAVFLTDHTLAGAIPVFFGSVCITLAFERSRSLYTGILIHTVYNGVITFQILSH